ncbi:MAG TPA: 2-amino-4-hydroxy-6-hydroxymethyldihydropteridine diphosphokinase [Coriobacteriia bacterium]
MTTAYIGLGSNEGDRLASLAAAVEALSEIPDTHLEHVSHAYESEPAYVENQPKFANAVAEVTTTLESSQLLSYLQQIEESLGRVRGLDKGPRTIDLDILVFGDEELVSDALTIPHPHLLEREFVVVPLLDIAPRLHLPDGTLVTREGATVGEIVGDLGPVADLGVVRNDPALVSDWVEVARCDGGNDVTSGWDAAISIQRQVLEDANIPFAFDPYPPDAAMDPWGMPVTYRLLVPAEYADKANAMIAEAMSVEPEFPEDLGGPAPE